MSEPVYFNCQRAHYFEDRQGKAAKFWEISLEGISTQIRFGRVGTAGRRKMESYESVEQAKAEGNRLIREKHGKGYEYIPLPERPQPRKIRYRDAGARRRPVTRWGGLPSGSPERPWPRCHSCERPMSFVVQLRAEDIVLPGGRRALQVYACLASKSCTPYDPDSGCNHVDLLDASLPASCVTAPSDTLLLPDRAMTLVPSAEPPQPDFDAPDGAYDEWWELAYGDKLYGTQATGNESREILCPACNRWQLFLAQLSSGPMDEFEDWFTSIIKVCPYGHTASFQAVR